MLDYGVSPPKRVCRVLDFGSDKPFGIAFAPTRNRGGWQFPLDNPRAAKFWWNVLRHNDAAEEDDDRATDPAISFSRGDSA